MTEQEVEDKIKQEALALTQEDIDKMRVERKLRQKQEERAEHIASGIALSIFFGLFGWIVCICCSSPNRNIPVVLLAAATTLVVSRLLRK